MEITEALKLKGKPFHIPDSGSEKLAEFIKEHGCKVGVEIGVYKAEYSEILCKTGIKKLYGVDPWGIFPDYPNYKTKFIFRQQELFGMAMKRMEKYKNFVPIRKTSMEAARNFKVESIDFVYIDGNHKFKYIAEDLYEWAKRVKPGGIVSGHDYYNSKGYDDLVRCKDVINAYVNAYSIDTFYTLGGEKSEKTKHRDRWKSWFWIKI
jgi:hypothetical protein